MTRLLLYSHDTYGLGHFRRCCLLASGLVGANPLNEVLIVTGSPRVHAFSLPERVDTVKLPSATKDDSGCYSPRKLAGGIDALVQIRSELITAAATSYEPDVVVVDHAPLGMCGELGGMFDTVETMRHRPRLVLGLRDIVDEAGRTDAAWHRDGIWHHLDRYDDVVVYGDTKITTTADELGLEHRTSATVTHSGYLAPAMPEPSTDEPFLLVTSGGGGDGQGLLRRYFDAVEAGATTGMRSVVVTGPLLSAGRRAELMMRAAPLGSVELVEFSEDMRTLIASAAGIISMAGYNTVVEELAARTPALLVPRTAPRLEQHLRATRLARVTPLEHSPLEALDAARIRRFVDHCTHADRLRPDIDLDGVSSVVNMLSQTAETLTHV